MAGFLQERVLTTNTDGNHAKHTNAKKMAREARFMGRSLRSRWILGQAQKAGAGLALRVGRGVLAALLALALVPVVPGGFGAAQEAWADDAPAMPAAAPTFTHHPADSTYSKGANARFYVRASSGDGGYLSYRWYRSRAYDNPVANASTPGAAQDGIKAIKIAEPNGTSSVLTTTTPNDIAKTTYYYYWVEVTNHKDTNNDGDTTDVGETNVLDSALAQVKVVNRTLFPAIQHGDFEAYNVSIATNATPLYSVAGKTGYAAGGTYNKWNINQVSGKTVGAPFTVLTTYPQYLPTDGYWDTTHYSTTSREFKVLEIQPGVHFLNSKGVPTWERENTSSPYYSGRTQNESMVAELAAYEGSSIFQEIATVPGKIYEWSLDHGARSSDNDKIAVIIGPAINEEADYAAFPNKRWSINTAVDSYGIDDDIKEILRTYRYGKNTDTYFQDILTQCADDQGEEILELNGAYSTTYGNKEFYVYVSTATNTQDFQHRAGSYTVPAGQGTTVFGFVRVNSESSSGGNILDNIVFASATGLNAEQEASYTGETSLSTPTQAGFAYALAEVRGSSVNELVGLSAYYNGSAIAPDGTLGTGGWYTNGSSGFATGGTITFKDLVPGKTYRIIGIPALAINTALHTNESPGNVLDNAYYKDVKIQAVFAGAANALPAWDVELYGTADGQKARVTLKNTNAQVQYALLADGGETPVTTGPALPGTAWKGSTSGSVTFEGLALGSTYWLVSRPAGYTEITYADAAWGSDGKRVAVQVSTPAADAVDLDAASVSRAVDKTTITIAATGTRAGYDYALFNPATGQIVTQFGGPFTHNGSDIKFSSLEPNTTYQVVSRLSGGAWLKGVRVYPYPSTFTADFVNNAVRSNADASNGFIPTNTEYRVQIAGGGAWLIGNPLTWKRGTGTERLELAQAGVTSDGKSIFGALGTGAGTVTVSYRLAPADGYVGASVQPVTEWTLPARPAAPPTSAVTIDYANEQLVASGAALQWRAENSSNYSALAANGEVDFETLGWNAAAGQRVALRYPAVAGSVFASHDSAVLTLSKRPDAPEGLMAALVLASDPGQGIIISNFLPGRSYEYSRSTEGERTWTAMPADGKLPYGTNFGDYDIRFAATNEAPASFYATVSSPLNTSALNLGSTVFGAVDATTPHYLTINNILSEEVTLEPDAITLTGTGSEYFTLAKPAASVTVPAANNSEVGQDKTSWSITPVAGIPAGSYLIQVNVAYSHGGSNYTCKSNVYFTVDKADWDLSGLSATVVPGSITSSSFAVSVSDVPAGAQLSYQLGGGAWSSYDAAGVATHTFNDGLAAARSYEVHVRVGSDGSVGSDTNHKESAAVTLLTVGTAQAQPDAAAVVHVNYADETLVFASGYQPDDYLVTVAGDSSGAPLTSGSSLIAWANASVGSSFTLQVVRKASALGAVTYPASTPGSLPVAGRAAAPVLGTGGITTTSASDDNTANGTINLTGTFQYRSYRNGVDVTTDWESASGSVNVTPGRYEVRRGPTSSAFGSAIAFVSVGSKSPSVSVFTKTALPTGGGSGSIVPEYLSLPSGWAPKAEEGQYDHSYLTSPLTLPAVEAVTSRSHIFRGWYGNPGLTGSAVTEVQDDNPYNAVHHNYYAKWVARPMVTTVAGATPVRDSNTASLGLTRDAPVKLAVTLPTGKNTLTLSDITLNGAAPGTAVLYPDASFSAAVGGGGLPLAWAGEDGYPTHAWLEVAALGDSAPQVYVDYELTLYTTRPVTVSAAAQVGGAGAAGADDLAGLGIRTTTGIALTFSEPVVGLTADDITLTNGTGQAVKGALSGSGASYTLAVSGVVQGTVNVAVADWAGYDVGNTAQPVAVYTDRTAPTGSISIEDNAFTEFLNTSTFGLFFDETVDVTIAAEDVGGDGLASVQYLKTTADLGSAEAVLEVPDSDWEDGTVTGTGSAATGSASFAVEPNEKFFTYARFTDVTGNVAVINSDGTVVYTNSALDEDELSYTKLSGESKSLGVQLNGNTIADVAPAESLDEPLVRDEDYTVAEADGAATITLTAKYLESLSAGAAGVDHTEHTFAVLYNPLGEEFVSGAGGDGSDGSGAPNVPPATTTFTVDVVKATPNVELTVDPAPLAGVTYGDTITLRAVLTDSGTGAFDKAQPTGTVSFYKGTVAQGIRLNRVPVEVGGVGLRGRIDFSSSLIGANEVGHTFTAVYEGDENYKAVTPAPITGYRVNKAAQDALTVSEGDKAVTALGKPLDLEGGTFELSVEGGSGMGGYEWESSNLLVASVTPVEGSGNKRVTVKLLAVGNTTITAKRAGDSNHLATKAEVQLSVGKETTKPVPGGSAGITPNSTLAATNLGETSLTLSWAKATDAFPVGGSSALRYFVYSSDSTSNDIGTLADCLANGTLLNEGGSVDISELAVSELAADTPYWFNVVVVDESDNAAAYTSVRVVTPLAVELSGAVQYGGKNGRLDSTGVLLTFSNEVTGFEVAHVVVTVKGTTIEHGAITDAGDSDGATWLVSKPAGVTSAWANLDKASITVNGWAVSSGHSYRFANYTAASGASSTTWENIPLYAPVKRPLPTAAIDFEKELLTGLELGGFYAFASGTGDFGGGRTIGADGIYDHLPYNLPTTEETTLRVVQRGVGEDGEPGVDEQGYVDSDVQTLVVPARPAAPADFLVMQPDDDTATGGLTALDPTKHYEYRSTTATDADWTDITYGATVFTGLPSGPYYLRFEAVAAAGDGTGGVFASESAAFYIHAYEAVDFADVLEGYELSQVPAQTVTLDDIVEAASVEWEDSPLAASQFTLAEDADSNTWTVQPKEGLAAGTYT
ncbi:MAG: hypothetical protein LBC23_05595, partial [Coriobacteriales bacterium]|nr:hypothetical protein [Coriobacteriales bacterium]